jgi:ABC-type molybdenum transport system ATPase subunit/photorepair protein PhrA
MIGPPGSGKTMLAKLVPTILPPMAFNEAIETTNKFRTITSPKRFSIATWIGAVSLNRTWVEGFRVQRSGLKIPQTSFYLQ